MDCGHDPGYRLPRSAGLSLCLGCFFDAFQAGAQGSASVHELSAIIFGPEGRAQCLASRLLWRTSFLKWSAEALATSAEPAAHLHLIDFLSRCVAEEFLGQATMACGVDSRKAAVSGMLLEALVSHVAQHCTTYTVDVGSKAPSLGILLLFHLLERILEACGAVPAVLESLCRNLEASGSVLATLVSSLACETVEPEHEDDRFRHSPGSLLLRLCERGSPALGAALTSAAARLSRTLAAATPGSQTATTLLAMYRMCALHPELFECLLSGDVTAHAESIAVGLSRHLTCQEPALRAAAAELAEDFGAHFAGHEEDERVEGWMRKAHLAQWLMEACQSGEDLATRAAAARAMGRFADDPVLLQGLQTSAADALVYACADAVRLPGAAAARRGLLLSATGSLERLAPGAGAYNPEVLVPLLRAAEQLPLRPGQGSVTLEECMEPVYLSAANRPPDLSSSECLGSLLGLAAALALRKEVGSRPVMYGALCKLFVGVADAAWASIQSRLAGADEGWHCADPVLSDVDVMVRCAEKIGSVAPSDQSLPKSHLVASLAALLWPLLELDTSSWSEDQALSLRGCLVKLGHLVPELCTEDDCEMLSEDLPQAEGSAMSDTSLAAGRLLTVLLAPYLSLGTTSLQLLVKPRDLCLASASLHSGQRPDTFMAWLVLGAALRASGHKGAELEEVALESLMEAALPLLPLRTVASLAAAVGRAVTRAAALPERAAFATEALGQASRALRGAAAQSMAYTGADEEWRLLKEDGAAELGSALGWLLVTVEDAEDAKDVLLSAVVLEYLEGCRLGGQVLENGSTTEIVCEPGDWTWLSQCLPSPMWMAQRVEVLLGHALQVHIDGLTMHSRAAAGGMLALMTTCLAESKAAGAMVSNHVVAGIAMKWQHSAMSEASLDAGEVRLVECIALFLLQQLASAPSGALQRSPLLAIVLETLQCKQKIAALATEVAAVALFRAWDVAQLRDLTAPSHALGKRLMEQGLMAQAGCPSHDVSGWAIISAWLLLLGAEGPTSAPRGPGLNLKSRSFQDWAQALDGHHSVVAFQPLGICLPELQRETVVDRLLLRRPA
eukprot:s190_g12.t1